MKTRKCFRFGPFYAPKHFFQKTLKISAPNSFFQNEPKFFYLILDFFNKFLMTWNWTIWRKKRGDWSLKIEFEECSLKIEFKESSLKIEGWRAKFEDWIWRKASFFGLVEALKSEIFIWKWISAQASTLTYFFSWYASGPEIPPTFDLGRRRSILWYAKQDKFSETNTFKAVRCCVTTTLAALTLVNRVPKLRFELVSFLFLVCFWIKAVEYNAWRHGIAPQIHKRRKNYKPKKSQKVDPSLPHRVT